MFSQLAKRIARLETLARHRPRRVAVVFENDWRENSPASIEPPPDPDADIIRIRYVDDWPPTPETVAPKAKHFHARVERGNVATAGDLRGSAARHPFRSFAALAAAPCNNLYAFRQATYNLQ